MGDVDWEKAAEGPPPLTTSPPLGYHPHRAPKIAVPVPAQQDRPGSMALIYRYYDGLGRGNSFPERVTRLGK